MFCRKCGTRILDDSIFCSECGTKVETVDRNVATDFSESKEDTHTSLINENAFAHDKFEANEYIKDLDGVEPNTSMDSCISDSRKRKTIGTIVISAIAIFVILILVFFSIENNRCEYYKECSNKKYNGKDYCYSHSCSYPNCRLSKSYRGDYCYIHKCSYVSCNHRVADGSDYCIIHTCNVDGCYNEVEADSSNCSEHRIDMRNKLSLPSMYFSINSAGGIKFSFSATNRSGKTIKYVRFNAYLKNAVGDPVQEEISNDYYADVEIIGPISNGETVWLNNEIIGYCDNLGRIDVRDITLIYTDGTSETGSYNYYCD
ncbi:MAG: zinc ribbon domain-containing protein [Ruminococcus sp.]|nr:zinc ribbon domain-containing protein [Ruminococcus sp.]